MSKKIVDLVLEIANKHSIADVALIDRLFETSIVKTLVEFFPDNKFSARVKLGLGQITAFRKVTVVEDAYFVGEGCSDDETMIPKSSKLLGKKFKIGDVFELPIELVKEEKSILLSICKNFKYLVREESDRKTFGDWKNHEGSVIEGVIEKIDESDKDKSVRGYYVLLLRANEVSGARGYLHRSEIVKYFLGNGVRSAEELAIGNTYVFYIKEVSDLLGANMIQLSRVHPNLVLFVMSKHIPGLQDGSVVVEEVVRVAGVKTKVFVSSTSSFSDPVGACIGPKGSRLKAVSDELSGERIDVILWNEDPLKNVLSAFTPARVSGYALNGEELIVILNGENFSPAIGRGGWNVRLVGMISPWMISIKSIDEVKAEKIDYKPVDDDRFSVSSSVYGGGFTYANSEANNTDPLSGLRKRVKRSAGLNNSD